MANDGLLLAVFDIEADRETREKAADNMIVLAKVDIYYIKYLNDFTMY